MPASTRSLEGANPLDSAAGLAGSPIYLLATLSILFAASVAGRPWTWARPPARWGSGSAALVGLVGIWLVAEQVGDLRAFAPALERLFGVLLAALVVWAALPSGSRLLAPLVAAALVLGVSLFLLGVAFPPEQLFAASSLDLAWTVLTLVAASIGLLAVVGLRPVAWGVLAAGLAALVLGQIGHALTPPAFDPEATSLSIAHAVAAPVFAIGGILRRLAGVEAAAPTAPPMATSSAAGLTAFTEALSAEDPDAFAAALTEAVAAATGAEVCLLIAPVDRHGVLRIGAAFDASASSRLPPARLEAASAPILSQAMALGRSVILPSGSHAPDLGSVLHAIGKPGRPAGLLVPLRRGETTVAAMLLLSPPDRPGWSDELRVTLDQQATVWGARLEGLMTGGSSAQAGTDDAGALDLARKRIDELEARLEWRPEAASELVGVEDLHRQLDESQETIEVLEAETERLRRALPARGAGPQEDAAHLQAELALALQALAEARAAATAEAPHSSSDVAPSAGMIASLEAARQPLTAIAGYTDLLLGETVGLLGSSQRLFLQRIRSAVRRMDAELGELTRAFGRPATPEASVVDVGGALEQALEGLHDRRRDKSLGLRLDLPAHPTSVLGDPRSVQDLLELLLTIALDQSPPGREIVVSLLAAAADQVAVIRMSDHPPAGPQPGPEGMPGGPADETTRGPDPPGLARVRLVAGRLGGRVWIERRQQGTTISVLLPTAAEGATPPAGTTSA
jgi:hypothetical protein